MKYSENSGTELVKTILIVEIYSEKLIHLFMYSINSTPSKIGVSRLVLG
jgi:hypothetical protein